MTLSAARFHGGLLEGFLSSSSEALQGYRLVPEPKALQVAFMRGWGWTRDPPSVSDHRTGLLGPLSTPSVCIFGGHGK